MQSGHLQGYLILDDVHRQAPCIDYAVALTSAGEAREFEF
jgi:hypothetical protein